MNARYVLVPNIGRCRVLGYEGSDLWRVLDPSDVVRFVSTSRITFLP
jgi:hypothetical protein